MVIRLRVLGSSEIRIGRKTITPSAEVVFALGVYLCVRAGDRLTREEVSEVFWGEGRESQGRHSLRQMLYRLRQKGLTLDEDGEELYLDPRRVESDLAGALEEGWPASADVAAVESAGALMPGFTRPISERFQAWLDGVRDRLSAQHRRAALRQIAVARREGRWADLDKWALQVLRTDPLNEEATLARAESAAISGSKAVALEIIDAYMEELGDRAAVIGLPASVLRRRIAERRSDWSGRGPREVPLVGRHELMARLTGYVDAAARGEGSAVLLWGAPGIGKTRLAEEVCSYATFEGFRVISVRAPVGRTTTPLGLLFPILRELKDCPGALGCDPASLNLIEKVTAQRPLRDASHAGYAFDSVSSALLEGLRELLDAVTSECRIVLMTDDVHNADDASMAFLRSAVLDSARRRLAWVATSRSRPAADSEWSGETGHALFVPPLDKESATAMAQSLTRESEMNSSVERSSRIATIAGGNPLFVRELTTNRTALSTPLTLPTSLHELIHSRLAGLGGLQTRVLRLATLLGPLATVSRLRSLGDPHGEFAAQLEALELQGIIHLGASHTIELHECWQQAILESLSPATRSALALECATLVDSETSRSVASSWRGAHLFQEAGEDLRAFGLYCECAETLLMQGLPEEAVPIVSAALEVAPTPSDRLRALVLRARAENATGAMRQLVTTCATALGVSRSGSEADLAHFATIASFHVEALAKTHAPYEKEMALLESLASNDKLEPLSRQLLCLRGLSIVFYNSSSSSADHFFSQSRRTTIAHGVCTAGSLVELIYFAERGEVQEVRRVDNVLAELEQEILPLDMRCRTVRSRAVAMRFIGDLSSARKYGDRAFQLSRSGGLYEECAAVCDAMACCALDREDLSDARIWLERWTQIGGGSRYGHRQQSFAHARARLCAQLGNFNEALSIHATAGEAVATDTLRRRRSVDLATVALCAASTGDAIAARDALTQIRELSHGDRASIQSDFCTEFSLRALLALNDMEQYSSVGSEYAKRRAMQFNVPIAPLYSEVRYFCAQVS